MPSTRRRLPSLNALRAFEAAGRCGSLTAAGKELQVSVAAISRHVALLEAYFGQSLLQRHRAGVAPTEKGARYLHEVASAFNLIERGGEALQRGQLNQRPRLRFYTTFTTEWLAPKLPAFHAAHPEIELDFTISTRDVDIAAGDFDLALTAIPPQGAGLHAEVLFDMVVTLVCTPGLRDGLPPLVAPADLARHMLLWAPRERLLWNALLTAHGLPALEDHRQLEFDTLSLTYQAARGGAGVALGNIFILIDDIRAGRLVAPLDLALRVDLPHYLVCGTSQLGNPAIAAFRDWLLAEAAKTSAYMDDFLRGRHVIAAKLDKSQAAGPHLS